MARWPELPEGLLAIEFGNRAGEWYHFKFVCMRVTLVRCHQDLVLDDADVCHSNQFTALSMPMLT